MKKNSWLMISAICTLTGASLAAAQPGHGGRFEKFDANKDGVVTAQEVEAAALARFNEADANKDGKVTAEERKAVHEQKREDRFADRDANDNGVLERSEVAKMPEEFFTKLDTDKSGSLSKAEMEGFGHGRRHGKHGDKGMRFDSDGDGAVSKAEALSKAKEMMTKFDTNKDGKVTKDEAAAFMASHKGRFGGGHCDHGPDAKKAQ
jgi:Ca2+-binding EF-hand superfamily protein